VFLDFQSLLEVFVTTVLNPDYYYSIVCTNKEHIEKLVWLCTIKEKKVYNVKTKIEQFKTMLSKCVFEGVFEVQKSVRMSHFFVYMQYSVCIIRNYIIAEHEYSMFWVYFKSFPYNV